MLATIRNRLLHCNNWLQCNNRLHCNNGLHCRNKSLQCNRSLHGNTLLDCSKSLLKYITCYHFFAAMPIYRQHDSKPLQTGISGPYHVPTDANIKRWRRMFGKATLDKLLNPKRKYNAKDGYIRQTKPKAVKNFLPQETPRSFEVPVPTTTTPSRKNPRMLQLEEVKNLFDKNVDTLTKTK